MKRPPLFFTFLLLVGGLFSYPFTNSAEASGTIIVNSLDDARAWDGNCSLRDAIYSANNGRAFDGCNTPNPNFNSILFADELAGQTLHLQQHQLYVTNDMAIRGDVIIDGQYRSRIFDVTGNAALSLTGLTLRRGHDDIGGAIFVQHGRVSLRDATLMRNSTRYFGGAIALGPQKNNLSLVNVDFQQNNSELGGAIYVGNGNSNLTIYDSAFSNNGASSGGAIYQLGGSADVNNSTFRANNAGGRPAPEGLGGAFYFDDVQLYLNYTTVTGSTCAVGGCAMYANNSRGVLNFSTFNFNQPMFPGELPVNGGALHLVDSQLEIIVGTFTGNKAQQGGSIYADGGLIELRGSEVRDNRTTQSGGGIHLTGGAYLDSIGLLIVNNHSSRGGALFADTTESSAWLKDSFFQFNRAVSGGAIFSESLDPNGRFSVTLENGVLQENSAIDGSVVFNRNSITNIADATIARNVSNAIINVSGLVTLTGSTIINSQYQNCVGVITVDAERPNVADDDSCGGAVGDWFR